MSAGVSPPISTVALRRLAFAPEGLADDLWFPHPADATWTLQVVQNSVYATTPTTEKVTVKSQKSPTFVLAWTTDGRKQLHRRDHLERHDDLRGSRPGHLRRLVEHAAPGHVPALLRFRHELRELDGKHTIFPDLGLAEAAASGAAQSSTWTSTGGATRTTCQKAPHFPWRAQNHGPRLPRARRGRWGTDADRQAGAQGDPYGSGTRTVWWSLRRRPLMITFQHAGRRQSARDDVDPAEHEPQAAATAWRHRLLPLHEGLKLTYSWTNTETPAHTRGQTFTVDAVVNNTRPFSRYRTSPARYGQEDRRLSKRASGVTDLWGTTSSATLLKFPPLGPARSSGLNQQNHFVTPFDLPNFGFQPGPPPHTRPRARKWSSEPVEQRLLDLRRHRHRNRDRRQTAKVPVSSFQALVVRSTLKQPGFPYGTGTRCWFAPAEGLVKLVFAHGDGSVSTVVLLKWRDSARNPDAGRYVTVTLNVRLMTLPAASVAVTVTVVVPTAKGCRTRTPAPTAWRK